MRFKSGTGVTVFNNTISGSKEGIYLLHSEGHKVYGNTILNSKISSITCYGSGNEYIFNNIFKGSRIAIILGGEYYNVTIGENSFTPDKLPFPPTFEQYLVKSENKYYAKDGTKSIGTYNDSQAINIIANNVTVEYKSGSFQISLKDNSGNPITNKTATIIIGSTPYSVKTNSNGIASINLSLDIGNYTATVHTASDYYHKEANAEATIMVTKATTALTASGKTVYLQAIQKGTSFQVTLKANGAALAGKQITVNYNGNNYKATTNSKGVATVTLKATKTGSKPARITFAGDDTYKETSKTVTVKVTKEATKITAKKKTFKAKTKTKKYTITLKSKSGSKLSKVKVTLKIKGKTYTATVKKGKAIFNLKKLTKKGKYTAKITFKSSKYYLGSTAKPKITIK